MTRGPGWMALLGTLGCHPSVSLPTEGTRTPQAAVVLSDETRSAWREDAQRRCNPVRLAEAKPPAARPEVPESIGGGLAEVRKVLREAAAGAAFEWTAWALWKAFDADASYAEALKPELRAVARASFVSSEAREAWVHPAWHRLGGLGDREVIPLLRRALGNDADWKGQVAAAESLGRMGAVASPALEDLERVARRHPFPWVRAAAQHAGLQVRGEQPEPLDRYAGWDTDPRWPVLFTHNHWALGWALGTFQFAPWAFERDGQRIVFASDPSGQPSLPPALASLDLAAQFPELPGVRAWRQSLTVVEPVAGGWLLGTSSGEFGGDAWWVGPDGEAQHLVSSNVVRWVTLGDAGYLLTGLRHLRSSRGELLRVHTTADGVRLTSAFVLPEFSAEVHALPNQLYQATPIGVLELTASLTPTLHTYVSPPFQHGPSERPLEHAATVQAQLDADALQRCLTPLLEPTQACEGEPWRAGAGVGVWVLVDADGEVSDVRPQSIGWPVAPEVFACLQGVVRGWDLHAPADGPVVFGWVFELGPQGGAGWRD